MGLVNEVVAPEDLLSRAMEIASVFARGPRNAMIAAKRAIDDGLPLTLEAGLGLEADQFAGLFGGAEQITGMTSFVANGPGAAVFE